MRNKNIFNKLSYKRKQIETLYFYKKFMILYLNFLYSVHSKIIVIINLTYAEPGNINIENCMLYFSSRTHNKNNRI